ncbi:DNA polymerase IV [bacterium]|nr:DNA polymerase IV [bacterium]
MLERAWPRALALIDGDAFFASVEQAVKPHLKGKPVVTGKERNIVAAASYEAKAMGVRRGVTLWDAKKMCPGLVVLPTDYETVSLFSKRMFDIMRRYSPVVEEYSIDEGFIGLTGLRRVHHSSYEKIARSIQNDIHAELDITVSVGLSVSKVLTKIAAEMGKPNGFTVISGRDIETKLADVPINDIWGIGSNTAALLIAHGMPTALSFAQKPREYVERILTKPGIEIWQELNGESVMPISMEEKESYQSIGKSKTFTPASTEYDYVFAQLVKNIENACIKARRYNQAAQEFSIYLKKQDHRSNGLRVKLDRPTCYPTELMNVARKLMDELWRPGTEYRATGVILSQLVAAKPVQPTLFEDPVQIVATQELFAALDTIREKYGKHAIHLAASLPAQHTQHLSSRGDLPTRKESLLKGENNRRRLPLPVIHTKLS